MFIMTVEEYTNILKIRDVRNKDIYTAQMLNNANGEKIIILRELLPSSENDTEYLIATSELLATKIYDMYFLEKVANHDAITWIEIYNSESFRGKKCQENYINQINFQWDSENKKYISPEWKSLSWGDFYKVVDQF
jgi:hypothetical protein